MNTPTYQSWYDMIRRCTHAHRPEYVNYGGRGITVCERWKLFANFVVDMGEKPDGLMLERKDNSLGYYKENCKWATRLEQNRNKRPYANSTSGVTGVSKHKTKGYEYWTAWGSEGDKTFRLYHGKDFNEAVRIRKEWEQSR
jgi:hypothetical protein